MCLLMRNNCALTPFAYAKVNRDLSVWWKAPQHQFFPGTVTSWDAESGKATVTFWDGDVVSYNLDNEAVAWH